MTAKSSGPLAAIAVACLVLVGAADAVPTKGELSQLRGRIQALQKELAEAESERREAADNLRSSEKNISDINRRIAQIRREGHRLGGELARLEGDARRVRQDITDGQERLKALLRHAYFSGGSDPVKVALNNDDPNRIARDLHYFGYISRSQARVIDELRANLHKLEQLSTQTRERRVSLESLREEQADRKRALAAEHDEHRKVLSQLSDQIRTQRKEIGRLKADEARLTRLVERLARLAATSAKKSRAKAPEKAVPGLKVNRTPDASLSGIAFAKLRGRLALPVAGELAGRFGVPREEGGATWKGLFIRAAAGAPVKAVASGTVVFSDWLRGFGNLLIVDHGGGYMSLYSNNETLYKQPGDRVGSGDIVATVGASGGNPEPGLYFELRRDAKPFDPMKWVSLK